MDNEESKGKYKCIICGKGWRHPTMADTCRDTHDVIFIPLMRSDLNRLLQYIVTHEERLLTPTLMKTLRHYMRGKPNAVVPGLYEPDKQEWGNNGRIRQTIFQSMVS